MDSKTSPLVHTPIVYPKPRPLTTRLSPARVMFQLLSCGHTRREHTTELLDIAWAQGPGFCKATSPVSHLSNRSLSHSKGTGARLAPCLGSGDQCLPLGPCHRIRSVATSGKHRSWDPGSTELKMRYLACSRSALGSKLSHCDPVLQGSSLSSSSDSTGVRSGSWGH